MNLQVNLVEAFWIIANGLTFILTVFAFLDARRDRQAVKLLNGPIRTTIANGNVRREAFRMLVQFLLLSVAVPAVFQPGEIGLSPPILALMAVPVVLFIASLMDQNDRHALTVLTVAQAGVTRDEQFEQLSAQIANGHRASRAAEDAANNTNEKIANLNERLLEQGERADTEIARTTEEAANIAQHQEVQDHRLDTVEGDSAR